MHSPRHAAPWHFRMIPWSPIGSQAVASPGDVQRFLPRHRHPPRPGRWISASRSAVTAGRSLQRLRPRLLPQPDLLANLLDEGPGASSVRALVVHDLREQPRLRVLGQDRGSAHLAGELHALWCRRDPWPRGNRGRRAMMRRLRLGDVVESVRRLGSSTRTMAAGTGRRAAAEGIADTPVPTAHTTGFTVQGILDGTSPWQVQVDSLAWETCSTPVGLTAPSLPRRRRA